MSGNGLLLEVEKLKKYFPVRKGIFKRVVGHIKAVDDISFDIRMGETLGLVGESGCGKTTTGRTILRLIRPSGGRISFHSRKLTDPGGPPNVIDLALASPKTVKALRREMQIIFQDPYSSLDPRKTVEEIIGEPLYVNGLGNRRERAERVAELLSVVGMKPEHMKRYPHEFSGGQRQRIGIARALSLNPELVVADEPVSALDVSIQAQVLNLLQDLQQEFGLTYLFIAHNLSVVRYISNRVAVMYLGRIVEMAPTKNLYSDPQHPYTEALMSAVPVADPYYEAKRIRLKGDVPSPYHPPSGCHFHPRCHRVKAICRTEAPILRRLSDEHFAACHFPSGLSDS